VIDGHVEAGRGQRLDVPHDLLGRPSGHGDDVDLRGRVTTDDPSGAHALESFQLGFKLDQLLPSWWRGMSFPEMLLPLGGDYRLAPRRALVVPLTEKLARARVPVKDCDVS
jgi:hypothetical protein